MPNTGSSKTNSGSELTEAVNNVNKQTTAETMPKDKESAATVVNNVYQENGPVLPSVYTADKEDKTEIIDDSNYLIYDDRDNIIKNSSVAETQKNINNKFPIKNKSGIYSIGFAPQSGDNLLKFSYQDASLLLNPINCLSVTGEVYKDKISYADIYVDTDLRYTADNNCVKEDLMVKKYTGQSEYTFDIDVSNAKYEKQTSGDIYFTDPDTERRLFYIAKPFAVDSNGTRCDLLDMEIAEDKLKVNIDAEWLKQAAYPITIDPTIYIFDGTFSRPSIAYKQDGSQVSANSPRYENGNFGQGIMIEEGTTNLLMANQSSAETGTTGFASWQGTLTRDTSINKVGSASLKVVTSEAANLWDGALTTPNTTIAGGGTYTFSVWVKNAVAGIPMMMNVVTQSGQLGSISWISTTEWARYSTTVTFASSDTTCYVRVSKNGYSPAVTFWVDGLQLEQKAYPTSYQTGGAVRNVECLDIPASGVFNKGNWTIKLTYKALYSSKTYQVLWLYFMDSSNYYQLMYISDTQELVMRIKSDGVYYDIQSGIYLDTTNFHDIAVTCDGVDVKLYADGVLTGTMTYVEPMGNLSNNMNIGYNLGSFNCNGIIDELQFDSVARTADEISAWYSSGQPLPIDEYTTCKMSFDNTLETYNYDGLDPTTSIFNGNFNRSSVAYKQSGSAVSANSPRYENGKFGQGIIIEEGTANLLLENQSNFESGITGWSLGTYAARSSADAYSGSYSLAITNPARPFENRCSVNGLTGGTTYTVSVWAKSTINYVRLNIVDLKGNTSLNHDAYNINITSAENSNTWKRYTFSRTLDSTADGILIRAIAGESGTSGIWYLDCFQIEHKPYATSFFDTEQNFIANSSFEADTSGWILSGQAARTNVKAYGGAYSIAATNPSNNQVAASYTVSGISGGSTYMLSVCANTTLTSSRINLVQYNSAGLALDFDRNNIYIDSNNGVWDKYSITVTTSPSAVSFLIRIIVGENGNTGVNYYDDIKLIKVRAAESLTIPTSGIFQKNNWSVESVFVPTSAKSANGNAIWEIGIDANNKYILCTNGSGQLTGWIVSGGNNYMITDTAALQTGTPYSIMFTGDGNNLCLYKNGSQIGNIPYQEPVGTIPDKMYIGLNYVMSCQANGIIDDLRISSCARTLAEHQTAYNSGQPLPIDTNTACKMSFDNTLGAESGRSIEYVYDSSNRLRTMMLPNGSTIDYEYDNNGNLLRRTVIMRTDGDI